MKRVEDNFYLEQRGRVWWYNRRVPRKFAHLDTRKRIKESLGTISIEQARYKRNLLAEADDHYWASLKIADEGVPSSNQEVSAVVGRRYKMATVKALASGFTYQPIDHLATEAPIEDALARLLAVHTQAGPKEIPKERDAEALLGGAKKPTITVTEAFEIYLSEIAYNAQLYKSPNQRASWEKTKRTSIQYFSERQSCQCNDDHRNNAGDWSFNRSEDLIERTFPGHAGACGIGRTCKHHPYIEADPALNGPVDETYLIIEDHGQVPSVTSESERETSGAVS